VNDTRNNVYAVIAVTVGAMAGLGPVSAQEPGKVMIDVADCIKLNAPEARLACYELRVAAVFGERAAQAAAARPAASTAASAPVVRSPEPAPAASSAPPATPEPAASSVPAARTVSAPAPAPEVSEPVQSRGDQQIRRAQNERAAAATAASDIVSRVQELREVVPNAWQITLDNGQVWRQTVSKRYQLRQGQQVKIYSTHWGNASRLSADEINGYIQVERVR
jgi:hypothetical protein